MYVGSISVVYTLINYSVPIFCSSCTAIIIYFTTRIYKLIVSHACHIVTKSDHLILIFNDLSQRKITNCF